MCSFTIDIYTAICYNIVTVKERLLSGGNTKGSEEMKPMTNEQSKRLEELIRENEKLLRKIKKLKHKLKNKK